jgi:hypothetical protein
VYKPPLVAGLQHSIKELYVPTIHLQQHMRLLLVLLAASSSRGFRQLRPYQQTINCRGVMASSEFPLQSAGTRLFTSSSGRVPEMNEANMTLDEIKAELDLRGVDYEDCISKGELVKRLVESRTLGRANPEVLQKLNDDFKDSDGNITDMLNSDIVDDVIAKDGGLPGGLSPELMKALSSSPEIMKMMRDPKMQVHGHLIDDCERYLIFCRILCRLL